MFTDSSSEGSPSERSGQCTQTAQNVEPQRTEPTIRESEREQAIRHKLSEVLTTPSVQVQTDHIGPRLVDRETNTSVVDIRPVEEEARDDLIHTHSIGIQMPSASSGLSLSIMDEREFIMDPRLPIRIPQLDGPLSVCTKRKLPVPIVRKHTMISGGDYPSGSESDSHDFRSQRDRRYPGRKGYHQGRGGKPPDKQGREYPKRGGPPDSGGPPFGGGPPYDGGSPYGGGPPDNGGPLMMEDPQMMEDPPIMEDPQEMEDHQEDLEDKDHQDPLDLLDQYILL